MYKKDMLQAILTLHISLKDALLLTDSSEEFLKVLKEIINRYFDENEQARLYYRGENFGAEAFGKLNWSDFAAIRIADMLKREGETFVDPNLHGATITSHPFTILWNAVQDSSIEIARDLLLDLTKMFAQFFGIDGYKKPTITELEGWMDNHPSGIDSEIVSQREENRDRIISVIIKNLRNDGGKAGKFQLDLTLSDEEQYSQVLNWWNESSFHLSFAIRDTELLNEMLGNCLDRETLTIM